MSKIIAILNQKGGAGKTTIATNLGHALQLDGYKVLLVDSDPQGSARDWNAASDGELLPVIGMDRHTLSKDIKAVIDNHDLIIIDGAPQIADLAVAAIKCADIVLIPVQPSPYDIWACEDLVEIIKARQEVTGKPKAAFVISRVIKNTQLSKEIREALEGYELPVFDNFTTQRVIYAKSAATGGTVLSSDASDVNAANEIKAIVAELKRFM
jgi:chromosome partitioning protein